MATDNATDSAGSGTRKCAIKKINKRKLSLLFFVCEMHTNWSVLVFAGQRDLDELYRDLKIHLDLG
jgi:hypothetical protein